jgi:outer membrane protein OmpA-like peptidoglycan-associated protein
MPRTKLILPTLLLCLSATAQEAYDVAVLDTRTQYADYAPVPCDSGFVMCSIREPVGGMVGFTDAATNMPLSDLYWVPIRNGVPGSPVLFSQVLTTPVNEGPSAFTPDGRTICFTRNQLLPKKLANLRKGNDALGLYFSRLENDAWTEPEPFVHNSNAYSVVHPAFSADGRMLYFASDMPGGHGGMDLYRCSRTADGWSAPENLGPVVNTTANEVFPTLDAHGVLRFSSDREGGMGKLDIYASAPQGNDHGPPVHLPTPVNSPANDVGFAYDRSGQQALFSSDRSGKDRIYAAHATIEKFRDCAEQRPDNYCYAMRTKQHAATRDLPLDHVWDMGDGTRYTGNVAQHCYKGPGTYTVRSLLVDRNTGTIFHELRSNVLELKAKEQAFVRAPDTLRTGRPVLLDGLLSHTPGFDPVEHHWDLGDGTKVQGSTVRHRFTAPGTYQVRLDVLAAPDAAGRIAHQCNFKRIVVLDKYRDSDDQTVVATYQDATGRVHTYVFQELPFDELTMAFDDANGDALFAIELFTSKERVSLDDPRFTEIRKFYRVVEHFDPKRAVYSYSVGGTGDMKELYKVFQKVRELQFLEAEVFRLQDEKLIDLSELDLTALQDLDRAKVRTNAIHFACKSAELDAPSLPILEQITTLLKEHPEVSLVIEAHTDDVGSEGYNLELSQRRAQSVLKHLVERGVDARRLTPVGHGKNQPIASNGTEEGRSLNRRVEFRMTVRGEEQAFEKTR